MSKIVVREENSERVVFETFSEIEAEIKFEEFLKNSKKCILELEKKNIELRRKN